MKTDRYSRQFTLPEIGSAGQSKIKAARVLCIGVGGLGSATSLYLVAAGVGTIGLIDPDRVDETNLQRQILYKTLDAGKNKVAAASQHLNELNPEVEIITHFERFTHLNAESILSKYDLVIDGSDNFETKFLVNDAAYKKNIPLIYGAINRFEGEVALFFGNQGACYRCFHPTHPLAEINNCVENGVLGSIAGVIGSLQATLVLQYIISKDEPEHPLLPTIGQLTTIDLMGNWNLRTLKVNKNSNCTLCSEHPEKNILQNIDLLEINSKNTLLIDVRETEEWINGHHPEAIHWPLSRLHQGELPPVSMNVEKIVLYCKSGVRSKQAVELLLNAGIKHDLLAIPFPH